MRARGAFRRLARRAPGHTSRCWLYRLGGVKTGKGVSIAKGVGLGSGVRIGQNARIGPEVTIGNAAVIGKGVEIRKGALIGPRAVIGEGAIIGENARVQDCSIGGHSLIEIGVIFTGSGDNWITIGEHCYLGIYAVLDGSGGLEIGDFVHVAGPSVGIWTHTSVYECLGGDGSEDRSKKVAARVRIESNVWVGGNTTIYPGVTVGHHAVILPNSAVDKDVASFSMVGGVPAKLKRLVEMGDEGARFAKAPTVDMVM